MMLSQEASPLEGQSLLQKGKKKRKRKGKKKIKKPEKPKDVAHFLVQKLQILMYVHAQAKMF